MATIESLDLATLTNNPQSIAEALEDVLETTSGNLGTLKTQVQNQVNDINTLLQQAQTAKDSIDNLLVDVESTDNYYTNTILNGWTGLDITLPPVDERGIRMQRFGKVYIAHVCIFKSTAINAGGTSTLLNLTDSEMKHPGSDVRMGINTLGNSYENDVVSDLYYDTSGGLQLAFNNAQGGNMNIISVFAGIDHG